MENEFRPTPGCLNRPPLKPDYWVKDGGYGSMSDDHDIAHYHQTLKLIPHAMSTDCKSELPECATCCNYRGPVVTEN